MRIISETRLKAFLAGKPVHAKAEKSVKTWLAIAKAAAWESPADVKSSFGKNVDFVASDNGSELAVFNIHANHYRLIAAIHFLASHPEKGRVYVLRIFDHPEYDRNKWKREL